MNKKFLSAMLTVAMFFAAGSAFVSCKDYDDDIKNLQSKIDGLQSTINTIQSQITQGYLLTGVESTTGGVTITLSNGKTYTITNGKDGKDGTNGVDGTNGTNGTNGKDGKDGTVWTIGEDGYWYYGDGEKFTKFTSTAFPDGVSAVGKDGAAGGSGTPGEGGAAGAKGETGNYWMPESDGYFYEYTAAGVKTGKKSDFKWNTGSEGATTPAVDAAWNTQSQTLTLSGLVDSNGQVTSVTISLNGTLTSLVFVPQLYLDGIESIEYPWIGGQFLVAKTITSRWDDLSHHGTDAKEMQDIQDPLWDYVPNTLARYYDVDTKTMKTTGGATYAKKQEALTAANEWIYGPAWAVQYHMNPANSAADYGVNAPAYMVLEPDVIYYNTRTAASDLNVSSPETFWTSKTPVAGTKGIVGALASKTYGKYGLWSQRSGQFSAEAGILTAGIQIAHPDLLAPWPTDETINANGANTATPAYKYGDWSWFGLSKYKEDYNKYDNTVALKLQDGNGGEVVSDYALLVPTRVQLEGLIWYNAPDYKEPNMPGYTYGPNRTTPGTRVGDEEGTVKVSNYDCTANRIHVWDSPEEALNDPDGAALELFVGDQVDLTKYLGVHFLKENLKKKEKATAQNNNFEDVYEVGCWKYGEEGAFGLHYEYQLIDYYNSTNQTHDSRYAAFNDWNGNWDSWVATNTINGNKCNTTGIIKVKSVTADGKTQDVESTTSVDREPLVRVMLKNADGKVLLDGYILLHINYEPDNKEIEYPEQAKTFDLCNGVELASNWSQFSNIVLQTALTNEQIQGFNDYYWADCKKGGTIAGDDGKYVTPDAKQVIAAADGHAQYQLKIFNFGDLYGNNISAAAQKAMKNGGASAYEENAIDGFQSNQGLGVAYYKPNGEGTTNHVFHWYLSPEEIEYITHDLQPSDYPVTVSRWIRYVAKDEKRGREVNNYSAPYPYIWVKMTMTITRKDNSVAYKTKDANYWYHWKTGDNNEGVAAANANYWSALAWDIQAPRNGYRINTFNRTIKNSVLGNEWNVGGKTYKHYFAPKPEKLVFYTYTRTSDANTKVSEAIAASPYVQAGTVKTKTVKSVVEDFEKLPAALQAKLLASGKVKQETRWITPQSSGTFNDGTGAYHAAFDLMYCKYVHPHNYANKTNFTPDPVNVIKTQDSHVWVEKELATTMQNCALDYTRGVFANKYLYSYNPETKAYIQIATLNQTSGEIELLKTGTTNFEEAKLVLNAYGYEGNHKNIYKELRTWVGLVANNGCDVAMYTYPEKTNKGMADESFDLNTFLISWQRPINTNAEPISPALDANTNENYFQLIDYLKLYDWRGDKPNQGYMYDGHYWFWAYYMLKSISLDMDPRSVYTNMHYGNDYNTLNTISTEVDLWAASDAFGGAGNAGLSIYNFNEATPRGIYDYNNANKETNIVNFMGTPNFTTPTTKYHAQKQRFGTIYYQNNGHNVTKFDVYIPYTIEYEWGWITRFADFIIDSTHGQH